MPATRKTAETSSSRSTAQPPPKPLAPRARQRAAKPSKAAAVPPAIAEERRRIVEVLKPVVEMMGRMLGPNTELVLHDLTLAARYCDRLALLDRGRIVAEGPAGSTLSPANLAAVYRVAALRGSHEGTSYLLPWTRLPDGSAPP